RDLAAGVEAAGGAVPRGGTLLQVGDLRLEAQQSRAVGAEGTQPLQPERVALRVVGRDEEIAQRLGEPLAGPLRVGLEAGLREDPAAEERGDLLLPPLPAEEG